MDLAKVFPSPFVLFDYSGATFSNLLDVGDGCWLVRVLLYFFPLGWPIKLNGSVLKVRIK